MYKRRRGLKQKLPYDYLLKYKDKTLSSYDHKFIKGCLHHQERYFQLNNLQWKIIKEIEKKYGV